MPHSDITHRVVSLMIAMCTAASFATAADEPAAAKPTPVVLCPECGMVFNIRRIEKPVAPVRETLPSITSSPRVGGMGSTTQPVPLFSLGSDGPHRVQRAPTTRSVWEITIRYDTGQFGFLTHDNEPEAKVGDRVRVVENVIELLGQPGR
jgi:hypothetical protein